MGANPDSIDFWGAEAPAHTVKLETFVIYRYEVTNAMYRACVKAAVCSPPKQYDAPGVGMYYGNEDFANYPVIYVPHAAAAAYCLWAGGRLPTEAEWEKAARGTDGRLFPWGNDPLDESRANSCDINCDHSTSNANLNDGYAGPAPVGSFPAGVSPYGAMDMAGNVLEWVSDWYQADYYAQSPEENPQGPVSGNKYTIRGGSWINDQSGLRTAARASTELSDALDTIGFRCALPADTSQWRSATIPTPLPTPVNLPAVNPQDSADLVYIPAGGFLMGADAGSPLFWGAEAPSHLVALTDYLIYKTEVSNEMYRSCVDAGACTLPISTTSQTRDQYWNAPEFAGYPVIYVSHTAAAAYCTWAGGRLPTEAEWEKAARGTDGRLFPWGDDFPDPDRANFCLGDCINMPEEEAKQPGSPDTEPVTSFSGGASPYGVLNVAGNVAEWVADWFQADYYANAPAENPTGPATGDQRGIRGGSWYNLPDALRAAARAGELPNLEFNKVGFRCVVDVPK
jgi:formylglycine-generating enzyme required for sulfatase activity